ncbi:hypothetical protein ACYTTR_12310, partial [Cobetia marina]
MLNHEECFFPFKNGHSCDQARQAAGTSPCEAPEEAPEEAKEQQHLLRRMRVLRAIFASTSRTT